MEEIPALVVEISNDDAIQRSWLENEIRTPLTFSERGDWVARIYKKYVVEFPKEALKHAALYLGITVPTAQRYWGLCGLPEDLQELVDQKILPLKIAQPIVKNTYDIRHIEQSQEKMRERAN